LRVRVCIVDQNTKNTSIWQHQVVALAASAHAQQREAQTQRVQQLQTMHDECDRLARAEDTAKVRSMTVGVFKITVCFKKPPLYSWTARKPL
jgi:hypothetical protein